MLVGELVNGTLTFVDLGRPLTAEMLRTFVGGGFESYLLVPNPAGDGDVLLLGHNDAYDLLPNVVTGEAGLMKGNVLISGIDAQGAHRSLTDRETVRFRVGPERRDGVPVLHIDA